MVGNVAGAELMNQTCGLITSVFAVSEAGSRRQATHQRVVVSMTEPTLRLCR